MKPLDPLLHSQLRLAVMSVLMNLDEAVDLVMFAFEHDATGTTGLPSININGGGIMGYITIEKGFAGKKPRTTCRITQLGKDAFAAYVDALRPYLGL